MMSKKIVLFSLLCPALAFAQSVFDYGSLMKKQFGNWDSERRMSKTSERLMTGESQPYVHGVYKTGYFKDDFGKDRLYILTKGIPDASSTCAGNCPEFLSAYFYTNDGTAWSFIGGDKNVSAIIGFSIQFIDISPIRIGKNTFGLAMKIQIEGGGVTGQNLAILAPIDGHAASVFEFRYISRSDGTLPCLDGICQNLNAALVADQNKSEAAFAEILVVENGVEVVQSKRGKILSGVRNRVSRFEFSPSDKKYRRVN